jgi:hypothetical protein
MTMRFTRTLSTLSAALLLAEPLIAHEIGEQFAVNAVLKEIYQHGQFEVDGNRDNQGHGLTGLDLAFIFKPTEQGEFSTLLRWGLGDALNNHWPGVLAPFAHDGEGDLTRINGSQRDYLLTAYYTHTFTWTEERSLGLSLGLIDSTGWLDENAYAADELGQFMNDALVHNPVLNLPVYDHGGAAHFQSGNWSVNGLALHSKSDDEVGRHFDYYGLQLGWRANLPAGEGNYRLIAYRTSADFLDPTGDFSALGGWGLSADQALTDSLGVFARYGSQNEDAAVDYRAQASVGLNLKGHAWGRADDSLGLGYAWLDGGHGDIEKSQVLEIYVNFVLTPQVNVTLDLQRMTDSLRDDQPERSAWIPGLRLVASF